MTETERPPGQRSGAPRTAVALIAVVAVLAIVAAAVVVNARRGEVPPTPSAGAGPLNRIVVANPPTDDCPDVGVVDVDTGQKRVLAVCSRAVIAPDGRHVAAARNGSIAVVDLDGGPDRVVGRPDTGSALPTGWSPAGRFVRWVVCPGSLNDRCDGGGWVAAADGSDAGPERIDAPEILWSAGDTRIAIHDTAQLGSTGGWAAGTGIGADRHPFDGSRPMWSPDGGHVAYASRFINGPRMVDVYLADPDNANPQVWASVACCVTDLEWSPDGRFVVVVAGESDGLVSTPGTLTLLSIGGGAKALAAPGLLDPVLRWSPTGADLLITGTSPIAGADPSSRETWIVHVDGTLPPQALGDVAAAWSPDGSLVAAVGRLGGGLAIVSAADGSTTRTFDRPVRGTIQNIQWVR